MLTKDKLACEIATLTYDSYAVKAYGISNCDINYTRGDLSEKIILKSIVDFGADCKSEVKTLNREVLWFLPIELQVVHIHEPHEEKQRFAPIFQNTIINNITNVTEQIFTNTNINSAAFQYVQVNPSLVWTIDYPLNYRPSITLVDTSGNTIEGSVQYISPDSAHGVLIVTYSEATAGSAYLS